MAIEFEVPNLDGTYPDELMELAKVLDTLATYCRAKANGMKYRANGRFLIADEEEGRCEHLYNRLPQWAKW